MPDWFGLDRTAGQEHALYVDAGKDTLRQQLTGWLAYAGIPVLVIRGFGSQSYADVVHDRVTATPATGFLSWSVISTARVRTSSGTGWPAPLAGAGRSVSC